MINMSFRFHEFTSLVVTAAQHSLHLVTPKIVVMVMVVVIAMVMEIVLMLDKYLQPSNTVDRTNERWTPRRR